MVVLIWKIASIIFGVLLLLLGIVGLFTPILPGVVMILAGLAILSAHSRMAKRLLTWLKQKAHLQQEKPAEGNVEQSTDEDRRARR